MARAKVLLQLDTDAQPSVFDAVVAVDAGVDHLLRHGAVTVQDAAALVHGLMFTRGLEDLRCSAVFVGGSRIEEGEQLAQAVLSCFFGPMRVSVMLDSGGANSTAAAAVLSAARHQDLGSARALVLAGTGAVGRRVARLLAREGAEVRLASRDARRAEEARAAIRSVLPAANVTAVATRDEAGLQLALQGVDLVVAAGAAGVQLLPRRVLQSAAVRVAVDLNAVPPAGIEGIETHARAVEAGGTICYGAIGVGALKMKIHKAAIRRLFERADQFLDAEEIFAIGQGLAT